MTLIQDNMPAVAKRRIRHFICDLCNAKAETITSGAPDRWQHLLINTRMGRGSGQTRTGGTHISLWFCRDCFEKLPQASRTRALWLQQLKSLTAQG